MSNDGLVGYSGTVGKSILKQRPIKKLYNTSNIKTIIGESFDTLIVSGISANKLLANKNPKADLDNIKELLDNLITCKCKNLVLISSIDVFNSDAYGINRKFAEDRIKEVFDTVHILRLPALYGDEIKKNTIFDMYNIIPNLLNRDLFNKLKENIEDIEDYYSYDEKIDLYCFDNKYKSNLNELRFRLLSLNETAMKFTNINSTFQFFNLDYINYYIDKIINFNIKEYNITSEPILIKDIIDKIDFISSNMFNNDATKLQEYNIKRDDIWASKDFIIDDIAKFVNKHLTNLFDYIKNRLSVSIIGANDLITQKNMINYAKTLGINNFETTPTKIDLKSINYCSIQSIFPGIDFNIFDNIPNILFSEQVNNLSKICRKLNINNIVFGSPKIRNTSNKELASSLFIKLSNITGRYISLEPNAKEYGTNFLCTLEETIDFIKEFKLEDYCRINLDLGTVIINNEHICNILNKDNIHLINHVHISAPFLQSIIKENRNTYLEAIKCLSILNYKGFYSLESLNKDYKKEINYFLSLFLNKGEY